MLVANQARLKIGSVVDFSLTEEQVLLRDSVTKYIAQNGGVERHRQLSMSERKYDEDSWQSFAQLGWLALPFSEDSGGLGGSVTDMMVLCESLGRGVIREPYLHTVVSCGGLLSHAGSDAQCGSYLPPIMEGQSQWAFAFAESQSGYDFSAISSTAAPEADGYRLNGEKIAVLNGHVADFFIVTALIDPNDCGTLSLFVVPAEQSGITRTTFTAVDGSGGAVLCFDNVLLPADSLLGEAGSALGSIDVVLDRAIVAAGAESLGAMQVLLDATVEYTKTREQFGQPIGKFQALQHRMAEMYLKLEETRSLLFNAAILLDQDSPEAPAACAGLKVKLAEAGRYISHESVQLHGGIGMTDELIVGHMFKRLLLLAKLYGDEDYYLDRYLRLQCA
jgi:alkylation response protein AidB-like acyl-CoA dehydrogenase